MQIIPIKTRIFIEKENLFNFIIDNISSLDNGDVIAITSKIVALSQGRTGKIEDKNQTIIRSAKRTIETLWALLTLTNDGWCINAGVDESNANHKIILLPKDVFITAEKLRRDICRHFSLKKIGILITDTKSVPLRVGTIGRAMGFAGFEPLKSYIGKKDIFGKKSRFTESNIADALSASAVLNMGEGNEQIPIVIIKDTPVRFTLKNNSRMKSSGLSISPEKDIFSFVYKNKK